MSRVLVTGASGFIGRSLVDHLTESGHQLTAVSRHGGSVFGGAVKSVHVGDLRRPRVWECIDFSAFDVVVHLAARAHVLRERHGDPIGEFRAVNVNPSIALFEACQCANVPRFVFVSSIGVNGTFTRGTRFSEADVPNPTEPYALSKWEAEQALQRLSHARATQLTVIRPALVYGRGARGNFFRLMDLIERGWPIPLPSIDARRHFLGLRNLCELVSVCMHHPSAGGETFLAADLNAVTTPELIACLANAMGRKARIVNMPYSLLLAIGSLAGKRAEAARLAGSLEIDTSKARRMLNWENDVDFPAGIREMVGAFLSDRHANR
jgi:nucleoside-diphosphate-sugar epimerase